MVAAAVAITATLMAWMEPTPAGVVSMTGEATYYDSGVMARVMTNRLLIDDPGEYPEWLADQDLVGAVALNRAGDLGRLVWLDGPAGIEGPFLVADCAQRAHYEDRERRGRIVEVDWATAERWRLRAPAEVVVWFVDPRLAARPVPRRR